MKVPKLFQDYSMFEVTIDDGPVVHGIYEVCAWDAVDALRKAHEMFHEQFPNTPLSVVTGTITIAWETGVEDA